MFQPNPGGAPPLHGLGLSARICVGAQIRFVHRTHLDLSEAAAAGFVLGGQQDLLHVLDLDLFTGWIWICPLSTWGTDRGDPFETRAN